jgi:aminobenzoyl-glutamate utilization protein B
MRCICIILLLFTVSPFVFAQPPRTVKGNKAAAVQYINTRQQQLAAWSNQLWRLAEPSFKETRSAALLISILREEGFSIQEAVCGIPTMFIATYGSVKPVIGLYGEYDADPNASNDTIPTRRELAKDSYGHGGGHNLLATGSLGAALAIKELIKKGKLSCSVRYYGTTAEGTAGGKTYLARDGYFNDLDYSFYWHPAPATWAATGPWDAVIDADIVFTGKRVNVIRTLPGDSNTLAAIELLFPKLQTLRRQMTTGARFNYTVRQWRDDVNQVPDTITLHIKVQCTQQSDANDLYKKIQEAVTSVVNTTGIVYTMRINRAAHQFLPNVTAMKVVQQNMELLGPVTYSPAEQTYTKALQQYLKLPQDGIEDKIGAFTDLSKRETLYGYSSDIGDASWFAPEVYFIVNSLPGVPMHQWPGTVFTGHSIGHKGMLQASKLLAMTIVDIVENKTVQAAIQKDFIEHRHNYRYQSFLPPGPPVMK